MITRCGDAKFGTFSQHAPVSITEWGSGGYYCDADTPESTVKFIGYLQEHRVGLEVGRGTGLRAASVARAGTSLRAVCRGSPASRAVRTATASTRWCKTWYATGVPAATPE